MSQQHEMEFADLHMDGPETSYRYRGPAYQEDEAGGYRQDGEYPSHTARPFMQENTAFAPKPDFYEGVNPTFMMQMRLGLLIVSLILWVIVFFGSIWVITRIPGGLAFVIDPMVFFGLAIFTILAALGNYFFGRRR
jgi:hypothetical protein